MSLEPNRIDLLEKRLRELENKLRGIPSPAYPDPGFHAKLTAATLISGADNRWKYDWEEVRFTDGDSNVGYESPADKRFGPYTAPVGTTGWAYNTTELDNTDLVAGSGWSDDVITMYDSFSLALSFNIEALNPIGTTQKGDSKFPVVFLRPFIIQPTGHWVYIFTGWNTPRISAAFVS